MTTRWFVEVSPADADTLKERYCVEAVQWQQALQATRKLRGDSGPLSRFSIELLDNGYRALDPSGRTLYSVAKAPDDAPLTADMPPASVPPSSFPMPSQRPPSRPPPADSRRPPRPAAQGVEHAMPVRRGPPQANGCRLLSQREEDPTDAVPITYREYAYAVGATFGEPDLRATLDHLLGQVQQTLANRGPGKYVQIALYDRVFSGRPPVPPIAVLAWKDWRGEPVVQVEARQAATPVEPPKASAPPPAVTHEPEPAVTKPAAVPGEPRPNPAPAPESAPVAARVADAPAPAPVAATAPVAAPARAAAPAAVAPPARAAKPGAARAQPAAPPVRARKAPDEDLISDLFERMHALRFMPDLVSGTEYVLETMWWLLPCEAVLIHVHDINTGEFVVVRAAGPNSEDVLLHRTSDKESLFRDALRQGRCLRIENARKEPHYSEGAWAKLGITVVRALCGPVQRSGRYFGMFELANPITDAPFYDSEMNALDYICEQFADFTANRPIVLTPAVVRRRE